MIRAPAFVHTPLLSLQAGAQLLIVSACNALIVAGCTPFSWRLSSTMRLNTRTKSQSRFRFPHAMQWLFSSQTHASSLSSQPSSMREWIGAMINTTGNTTYTAVYKWYGAQSAKIGTMCRWQRHCFLLFGRPISWRRSRIAIPHVLTNNVPWWCTAIVYCISLRNT